MFFTVVTRAGAFFLVGADFFFNFYSIREDALLQFEAPTGTFQLLPVEEFIVPEQASLEYKRFGALYVAHGQAEAMP